MYNCIDRILRTSRLYSHCAAVSLSSSVRAFFGRYKNWVKCTKIAHFPCSDENGLRKILYRCEARTVCTLHHHWMFVCFSKITHQNKNILPFRGRLQIPKHPKLICSHTLTNQCLCAVDMFARAQASFLVCGIQRDIHFVTILMTLPRFQRREYYHLEEASSGNSNR